METEPDGNFVKMKEYIISLENALHEKESEIDSINKKLYLIENEKISLITNINSKEKEVNQISNELTNYKTQLEISKRKQEELTKQNEELNTKMIELTQKNKTLEENIKLFDNSTEKDYMIQIAKLSNKVDELEISKSKLTFDKITLNNKINELISQNETEMKLFTFYKNNEIEQYKKTIASLNEMINDMNKKKSESIVVDTKKSNSQLLLEQISQLEDEISKLNEENFNLLKQNQGLKSESDEKNIQITHLENLIASMQKEVDASINEYKMRLEQAEKTSEENFYQSKETQSQIEELILERDELMRKNEELKKEYLQFNSTIKEANQTFSEKYQKFQNTINDYKAKISGYKERIKSLKLKINELYDEIDSLKKHNERVYEVLDTLDKSSIINPNYKSENNIFKTKETVYSSIGNSPMFRSTSFASHIVKDPLEAKQKKTLEEYKRVLTKVDMNLKQYSNLD